MTLDPSPSSDTASTSARPSCASSPPKTIVAVAGIRRKLNSKAMQTVLSEMRHMHEDDFEIIQLDEDMMNNRPVNQWPTAHVLLTLYSPTFPLQKVLRYISLRSPLLINNLHMQPAMMDRRLIRRVLKRAGVPIPPAIYLDRSAGDTVTQSGHNQNVLVIDSPCRCSTFSIEKPFVEKPVDPEDHNVYIYYKDGGVRKLFRKVKNQSSLFDPNATLARQQGDYIYEKFFEPRHLSDVKVYAVGQTYFHAESRKAPHIDGIVERDAKGYERRKPVQLTSTEHATCAKVVNAFDQFILGFDLLRLRYNHNEAGNDLNAFVIDVNGWSLVKNCPEYSKACAHRLAQHVKLRLHERRSLHIRALSLARSPSGEAAAAAVALVVVTPFGASLITGGVKDASRTSKKQPPVVDTNGASNDLLDDREFHHSPQCAV